MERLRPYCHDEILVTEPEPAPIERIKGKYRYMIMLRGNKLKRLRQAIRREVLHGNIPKEVDIYVDVDAQSLL
jgi:primosomal protein N' (replication factor Y)